MKAEFELTLFDDERTKKKLGAMSNIEVMFDDDRNPLPPEYYWFSDEVPLGSTIRVTMELISTPNAQAQFREERA